MKKVFKRLFKLLLILVLVLVLALAALIGVLSATEYNPASVEEAETVPLPGAAPAPDMRSIAPGAELKILSWNIGYAGLGKGSDFVLDGGNAPTTRPIGYFESPGESRYAASIVSKTTFASIPAGASI